MCPSVAHLAWNIPEISSEYDVGGSIHGAIGGLGTSIDRILARTEKHGSLQRALNESVFEVGGHYRCEHVTTNRVSIYPVRAFEEQTYMA